MKKGQVTAFIVLGIVLIVGAVFIFYLKTQDSAIEPTRIIEVPYELEPAYNYIEQCIKSKSLTALQLLGIQGGQIYIQDNYLSAEYSNITYAFFNDRSTLISKEQMENELQLLINDIVPSCSNTTLFPGIEFSSTHINSSININKNDVVFDITMPMSITQQNITKQVDRIKIIQNIRLGAIYDALSGIVNKSLQDPDWIDMTYLSGFDLKIDILPHDNNTLIYSIKDDKGAEPYVFLSAFNFKPNLKPVINIDDALYLTDGTPFLKKIDVIDPEGDSFICSDNTFLFDITEDCVILFTPEIPGEYDAVISVEDQRGNRAEKEVKIIVN